MGAWLMQDRPFGNFYLRCKVDGRRTFRNLKTNDPAAAEAELARVRAEQTGRPWANGNLRWHREDWEQFSNLRGQTRVAKQGYALAARAIQALSTQESRFAYLLVIPQTTILAELGRISDPTIMFLAADEICDRELRSKPAIAFLRNLRGRHSAARPSTLVDGIRRAIASYCARHPETRWPEIASRLRALACDVEDLDVEPARA